MVARGDSCPYKCKITSKEMPRVGNWQDLPSAMSVALNMKKVSSHFGSWAASSGHLPLGSQTPSLGMCELFRPSGVWCPHWAGCQLLHINQMCPRLIPWPPLYLLLGEHRHLLSPSAKQPKTPPTPCDDSQRQPTTINHFHS